MATPESTTVNFSSIISTTDIRFHHKYEHLFPRRKGVWMYGSLEEGIEHIKGEMNSGLNVQSNVRHTLLRLRNEYEAAKKIFIRRQARSDESPSQQSSLGRMGRLVQTICDLEILLLSYQENARINAQRINLTNELAQAISRIAEFKFYATFGDYFAIINQEIKTSPFFAHRTALGFRDKTLDTTAKLVAEIQGEEANKRDDKSASTPILDSINEAFEFVNDIFSSPDEIIRCFKAYATRNETFHTGVKEMAEEGRLQDLYASLVRDRAHLEWLAITSERKEEGLIVIEAVGNMFFAAWDRDDGTGYVPSAFGTTRFERGMSKRKAAGAKLNTDSVTKDPEKENAIFEKLKEKKRIATRDADALVEEHSRKSRYQNLSSFSEDLDKSRGDELRRQLEDLQIDHEASMRELQEVRKELEVQKAGAKRSAENGKESRRKKDLEIDSLRSQVFGLSLLSTTIVCTLVVVVLQRKK